MFVFFFSSRRRHTRLQGDWSSDVCSSDLPEPERRAELARAADDQVGLEQAQFGQGEEADVEPRRSEERRVGKESRSRRRPKRAKQKKTKKKTKGNDMKERRDTAVDARTRA